MKKQITITYEVEHIDHLGEDYTDHGMIYDHDHEAIQAKIFGLLADPETIEETGVFDHENEDEPFTATIRWEVKRS